MSAERYDALFEMIGDVVERVELDGGSAILRCRCSEPSHSALDEINNLRRIVLETTETRYGTYTTTSL